MIERSLASLYALIDTRGADPGSRSAPSEDLRALKEFLAEESVRLKSSTHTPFTIVRRILKTLRLHLLSHDIKTFVEGDNGELISCLMAQAESFVQGYHQKAQTNGQDVPAIILSLQQQFRVKAHRLHQQPCSPRTITKRVELIKKYLRPTSRILCIGDDDFVSVVLALAIPNEIVVLDLDPQVITLIQQAARQHHLRITCQRVDIRKPLPESLSSSFDLVVTDPIYSIDGMLLFLSVAEACLRKSVTSYLLSCGSRSMAGGKWQRVEEWAASRGLVIQEFLPGFNEYPKPARLQTMMNMAHRLFFRSPLIKACAGIPFLYSDLVVFRCDQPEKGMNYENAAIRGVGDS
jgi:hypothetical protein